MHLKVAYRNDTKNYRVEIVRYVWGADGKSTKEVIKRLGERLERFYSVLDLKLQAKTVPFDGSKIIYPT